MNVTYYTYPWAMQIPGGGERQLLAYRDHLARFGVDVQLFDMWRPRFDSGGIFHCFSVMPGLVEAFDYARRSGMRTVVSPNLWVTHETKDNYPLPTIWNMFKLADAIVVNSNAELRSLSDVYGFDARKFHVVYNAAETDFLIPEDPAVFRDAFAIAGPYVLNVANIEPRKNQLRFLEVLRQVRPDLTLVVAGRVRDQDYAEQCKALGGDGLKVVGALPYASNALRAALAGCEFFAMPSLLETPSIAAIEAAAAGAKVLLTDQGSTMEYFGDTVTYVSPTSDESMAHGIRAVMSTGCERSTWLARDRYLWPKVVPQLLGVYRTLDS